MFFIKVWDFYGLCRKIYNQYGSRLYDIIKENPYQLADDISGIGFKLADDVAHRAGIGTNSEYRIRSGIIYMLQQGTLSGHTYLPQICWRTALHSFWGRMCP